MILESLFNILNEEESKDRLVHGFTMQPIKNKNYKVMHEKKEVCTISFINKTDESYDDLETAQTNPNNYNIYITEIKQNDKIKLYTKKLTDLGFVNISKQ